MKKCYCLFLLFFLLKSGSAQDPAFRLFLIGDTGEDDTLEATMKNFLDTVKNYPNSAIVFLGDNSYKKYFFGIGEKKGFDNSAITKKRLDAQLNGLQNYSGSAFFIPGNHDWWNTTNFKRGTRKVKMEEDYIETNLKKNTTLQNSDYPFMPQDGAGIASADVNDHRLRLIFIDSQWLLLHQEKMSGYDETALATFYNDFANLLATAKAADQQIVVTAHHPVYTMGAHSRESKGKIPKFYKDQDIYYPAYNTMRKKLDSIMTALSYPLIYASGHDHVLQYFKKADISYISSGAGSKVTAFDKKQKLEFNPAPQSEIPQERHLCANEGFFMVEYSAGDAVIRICSDHGTKMCPVSPPGNCPCE
jgi:hypothetical protein